MSPSVIVTASISGLFILAAFCWSIWRVFHARGLWRLAHIAIVVLMLGGGISVYLNQIGPGVLIGLALTLVSLAVLLFDRARMRWLAFIQVFCAILLAAGAPFGTG